MPFFLLFYLTVREFILICFKLSSLILLVDMKFNIFEVKCKTNIRMIQEMYKLIKNHKNVNPKFETYIILQCTIELLLQRL